MSLQYEELNILYCTEYDKSYNLTMTGKGMPYRTRTIQGFFTQLYIFVLEISAPAIDLGETLLF
jgi:hypothetical protein